MLALSRQGRIELARRAGAELALIIAAVAGLGHSAWIAAFVVLGLAAVIYILPPRPRPPAKAWFTGRMQSVYMPDLLGALLVTTFFALPFVIAARDTMIDSALGPFLLTGLPGAVSLTIFWIAAKSHCFWVKPADDRLIVTTIHGQDDLPFGDITGARHAERRLPRWVCAMLTLFGGIRGAGVALLHGNRAANYLVVERRAGAPVTLPIDAVARLGDLLATLAEAGVPLAPGLTPGGASTQGERRV